MTTTNKIKFNRKRVINLSKKWHFNNDDYDKWENRKRNSRSFKSNF